MKTPTWLKALAFLRFIVRHDGIERKFWAYPKALEYKNTVLESSQNLSFLGLHVFRGWIAFYYKYSPTRPRISFSNNNDAGKAVMIDFDDWTADAEF